MGRDGDLGVTRERIGQRKQNPVRVVEKNLLVLTADVGESSFSFEKAWPPPTICLTPHLYVPAWGRNSSVQALCSGVRGAPV